MKVDEARKEYSIAWDTISKRMDAITKDTDAVFIPSSAALAKVGEVDVLEVTALTDLVLSDSDEDFALIKFSAPIAPLAKWVPRIAWSKPDAKDEGCEKGPYWTPPTHPSM